MTEETREHGRQFDIMPALERSNLIEEVAGPVNSSRVDSIDSPEHGDVISLADFNRVVLRVGEILAAEPIPGSTRLLAVTVDLGREQRRVVAGLGQAYAPQELVGLRVVVVANLAPATIRGVESQGMLLGVGCEEPNAVALLTVNRPVPNGAAVV